MITYITWSHDIDAAFREFYPTVALEGEVVQSIPEKLDEQQNAIEWPSDTPATYYKIGTSRLTAEGIAALTAEFGDAISFPEAEM